jgi:hypothetical protein
LEKTMTTSFQILTSWPFIVMFQYHSTSAVEAAPWSDLRIFQPCIYVERDYIFSAMNNSFLSRTPATTPLNKFGV